MRKIAVLGCGYAGLLVAIKAKRSNSSAEVLCIDRDFAGGLLRSVALNGFVFDVGGSHVVFSKRREIVKVEAAYVLVVEKDAIFQRLVREKYWSQENAILITAKGMPDRATRRFVRRLNEEYKLPVYVLTDGDPYGWYIYSVYKSGSIKLSYESERLATPDAKFLGLTATDIDAYKISDNYVIAANDRDVKRAQELLRYPWFQKPEWTREVNLFLKKKKKVEIEALSTHGLKFLHDYLKDKIRGKKFID